jgi:predicted cation transporter
MISLELSFLILSIVSITVDHLAPLIFETASLIVKSFTDPVSIITILSKGNNPALNAGDPFISSST